MNGPNRSVPLTTSPLPGPSRVLERRWKERDAARHRKRLAEMKSTIGNDLRKAPVFSKGPNANREI